MFKDAIQLKRYCEGCGNITHIQITKRVIHKMSMDQNITVVTVSILIIIFLELVKLST